jgi:hypothetical protein
MFWDEFWVNLRTAVRFLVPTVSTDSPSQDADYLERLLQSAAVWLTPRSVDEFEPQDFTFLDPADFEQLCRNVEAFRRVASQVSGDKPASPQQLQEAATAFEQIVRLLRPHQFLDFESFKIQYRLERALRGKLPHWIESFVCQTGTDVGNDPAVWVTLNVSQEAVDKELVVKEGRLVREVVDAAVRRLRVGRWPYVRFQSLDELAAMRKGRRSVLGAHRKVPASQDLS